MQFTSILILFLSILNQVLCSPLQKERNERVTNKILETAAAIPGMMDLYTGIFAGFSVTDYYKNLFLSERLLFFEVEKLAVKIERAGIKYRNMNWWNAFSNAALNGAIQSSYQNLLILRRLKRVIASTNDNEESGLELNNEPGSTEPEHRLDHWLSNLNEMIQSFQNYKTNSKNYVLPKDEEVGMRLLNEIDAKMKFSLSNLNGNDTTRASKYFHFLKLLPSLKRNQSNGSTFVTIQMPLLNPVRQARRPNHILISSNPDSMEQHSGMSCRSLVLYSDRVEYLHENMDEWISLLKAIASTCPLHSSANQVRTKNIIDQVQKASELLASSLDVDDVISAANLLNRQMNLIANGNSPCSESVQMLATFLIKHRIVDALQSPINGDTLLMHSVRQGDSFVFDALTDYLTAEHQAWLKSQHAFYDLFDFSSVNARNMKGQTALHLIADLMKEKRSIHRQIETLDVSAAQHMVQVFIKSDPLVLKHSLVSTGLTKYWHDALLLIRLKENRRSLQHVVEPFCKDQRFSYSFRQMPKLCPYEMSTLPLFQKDAFQNSYPFGLRAYLNYNIFSHEGRVAAKLLLTPDSSIGKIYVMPQCCPEDMPDTIEWLAAKKVHCIQSCSIQVEQGHCNLVTFCPKLPVDLKEKFEKLTAYITVGELDSSGNLCNPEVAYEDLRLDGPVELNFYQLYGHYKVAKVSLANIEHADFPVETPTHDWCDKHSSLLSNISILCQTHYQGDCKLTVLLSKKDLFSSASRWQNRDPVYLCVYWTVEGFEDVENRAMLLPVLRD